MGKLSLIKIIKEIKVRPKLKIDWDNIGWVRANLKNDIRELQYIHLGDYLVKAKDINANEDTYLGLIPISKFENFQFFIKIDKLSDTFYTVKKLINSGRYKIIQ